MLALVFPGQGSQYTGMFKEHFEEFDELFEFKKSNISISSRVSFLFSQ